MSKKSKRVISKKIIDFLKKKCCSREELKELLQEELPKLSPEAVRKRVERYSNELVELGLVDKRGHKYCWYVYINDFKDRGDDDTQLLHSRELIPALRQIAGITWSRYAVTSSEKFVSLDDMKILVECAEEHLRAYPDVWKLLEEYRRKEEKVKQSRERFRINLMKKLHEKFPVEPFIDPIEAGRRQSFVGSNIPLLIYNHLVFDTSIEIVPSAKERIKVGGTLVAKGSELLSLVSEFIEGEARDKNNVSAAKWSKKIDSERRKAEQKLRDEIRKLILSIESGKALVAGCDICEYLYRKRTSYR